MGEQRPENRNVALTLSAPEAKQQQTDWARRVTSRDSAGCCDFARTRRHTVTTLHRDFLESSGAHAGLSWHTRRATAQPMTQVSSYPISNSFIQVQHIRNSEIQRRHGKWITG